MTQQACPICGAEVAASERYLRRVCDPCADRATSTDGRPLAFSNLGLSGGYDARYADTGEAYESHECLIDGVRCRADEARFGGIVIEAEADATAARQKPQWEQALDAVIALGGKATAREVWEVLKKQRPDIPYSTVQPDLYSLSVNSPARTSYSAGRQPRRTDGGNRYDRLFKVDDGPDAHYVLYDPKVHGVWEVYPDPAAGSSHGNAVRQVEAVPPAITVLLTGKEAKPGNTYFPVKWSAPFFPESMMRGREPDTPGTPARFTTDAGTEFQSDIYMKGTNAGYLHNRAAASAYYRAKNVSGGDRLRYEQRADGGYHISHIPAGLPGTGGEGAQGTEPNNEERSTMSVNKILFGPPGTGKTYRTVDEALSILDPEFQEANGSDRAALKGRFDELVHAGLVRFVTFHQSFSYEDFVEGIRATTDEDTGQLRYAVEDGVFKQLCDAARSRTVAEMGSSVDVAGRRIWKLSLGDAITQPHVFDDCMEMDVALLGFGACADLSGIQSRADIVERMRAAGREVDEGDYAVTALNTFIREVETGDLVVVTEGNLKFRAIGEVSGDYVHVPRHGVDTYEQGRPIRWLRQYEPARPYADLMDKQFSQRTIYELRPGSISLDRLSALLAPEEPDRRHTPEARVLIIDEINRGNVSRIFGELITLIEPSKREGCDEALEVVLPYSKSRFSVPRNVHLIGTMNTADRSLAGLDVALRRRFEFTEMLPDVGALAGIQVDGIQVDTLLSTMNRRIEVLLGRDYTLGHAYFMRLKETPTLAVLAEIFRRQVLPLLQEYFFEDWQKIAWVLNDHRKPDALRFVRQSNGDMASLLGEGIELPGEGRLWAINAPAFALADAYRGITQGGPAGQ